MKVRWNEPLGKEVCPYLRRWMVDFGPFAIRLHHWYRSDDKRAPHDHPWWFATCVIAGSYDDWSYQAKDGIPDLDQRKVDHLHRGSVRFRPSRHVHSVAVREGGCWTLMISGRPIKRWGFWVRRKDGTPRFKKSNKYFKEDGHHPCDQI